MLFLLPATVSAQDACESIGKDPKWLEGMQQIVTTMQANDMLNAKVQAKALADICPNAPMLNYLQGKISEALDEKADALYYYQKASENTYTFAVDPDNAKKIWYKRYEMENPERTASAVASSNDNRSALEGEIAKLKETISQQAALNLNHTNTYKKALWAGIGIGIGGLALAGGGLGMVLSDNNKYEVKHHINESDINTYTFTNLYTAGWTLIGVGTALAAGGAVLAGIFGAKYSASSNVEAPDTPNYSFSITPFSTSFTYRF